MKTCYKCKIEKPISLFYKKGKYLQSSCKLCLKEYKKQIYKNDRDRALSIAKDYYKNNKEEISIYNKNYKKIHKEEIKIYDKNYYENNKEEITVKSIVYREINKDKIRIQKNKYEKEKKKKDPCFKLRKNISKAINNALKRSGSSKKGQSCLQYLPFTIDEMKTHLQSLFEPWMNWDNQGVYNKKTWDDNDNSTWTWNLDHFIPQSDLPYSEMTSENFKKTWELSNIRPLSAKQNILDGSNIIIHKKKSK